MGQIWASICCCCASKKKSDLSNKCKDSDNITPSKIPDNELTEEFKIPDNRFRNECDVFEFRGYDHKNREELAKGGFATVFKIKKTKENKFFALKVIVFTTKDSIRSREKNVQKFQELKNEIFVATTIKHKNITQILDHFIINNTCYLILEFANKGTVDEEVKRLGPMTEKKAKTYFIQMARALEHLHLHKPSIAHRDLKLANILIHTTTTEKIIKLTDFGFSKVLNEKSNQKIFRDRYAVGTRPYMSPQMLRLILRHQIIDPKVKEEMRQMCSKVKDVNPIKADMWSLGVCLYVMITRRFPFDIDTSDLLATVEDQINRKRGPIEKKISLQLNDVLNQMLEPDTYYRINISDLIKHKWLSGVPEVMQIKGNKTVKTAKTFKA